MEHDFLGRFSGKFPGENKVVRLISQTEIRVPFLQSYLCYPFYVLGLRSRFSVKGTDLYKW